MIKHVILWKLRADHDPEDMAKKIAYCKDAFAALRHKIPGLISIKLYTSPLPTSTCDLMLDTVFEDEASYLGYKTHPEHLAVASVIRPLITERVCMDCEA